jgi:phenylacetic acid degradation operon negative regulatory protein
VLLSLLGELVYPNKEPVWTSSLLYMLVGLGIEQQTARQAIARAAAAGWITAQRQGREVRWELTPAGDGIIERGMERVYSLHAATEPWDRRWLILFVTIPESRRTVRKKLYTALSWEGFGNPTPGVWLSPHPGRKDRANRVVEELDLVDSTLAFVGTSADIGQSEADIVRQSWDLNEVTHKYEQLLVRFSGLSPAPGDPVLFTHIQLVNEWQHFPFMDPQLPEALVPNWIGRRAAVVFQQLRSNWYDDAQARWHEVVKETAPR